MSEKGASSRRGSILVVTLFVMSVLSILLFTATGTVLLAHKAQIAFERFVDLFYVAEAGLAHAQAVCPAKKAGMPGQEEEGGSHGDAVSEPESLPSDPWEPFAGGAYLLRFYLPEDPHPELTLPYGNGGMLVEVEARLEPNLRTRIFMLLKDPPSCEMSAWWQEREM